MDITSTRLDKILVANATYDATTKLLHWLTALLVLALFGLSQLWGYIPDRPTRALMVHTHVGLGVLLCVTIVLRIVWRLGFGRRLPWADPGVQGLAAHGMHLLLYGLIVVQAVDGLSRRWVRGRGVEFFTWFDIPSPITHNEALRPAINWVHNWNAWLIMVLVAGHVAAALFHHYVIRDGLLRRMLPAVR
jgi:cytochrome b561